VGREKKTVQNRKGGKEGMWVMGKEMNNHQYSPDKARVILDVSSEAGLGPRRGMDGYKRGRDCWSPLAVLD